MAKSKPKPTVKELAARLGAPEEDVLALVRNRGLDANSAAALVPSAIVRQLERAYGVPTTGIPSRGVAGSSDRGGPTRVISSTPRDPATKRSGREKRPARLSSDEEAVVRKLVAEIGLHPSSSADRLAQVVGEDPSQILRLLLRMPMFTVDGTGRGWVLARKELKPNMKASQTAKAKSPRRKGGRRAPAQTSGHGEAQSSRAKKESENAVNPSQAAESRVLMTRGGSVYHSTENCHKLRHGWAMAIDAGFHKTKLLTVPVSTAVAQGRSKCSGCW